MVPCAYLRVFEPLDALPDAEREHWGAYVSAGAGVSARDAVAAEAARSAARLVTGRVRVDDGAALVRRVGSRLHVCPIQLELRTAVAALAFRETVPDEIAETFVPGPEASRARDAVHRAQRPPHIREAPWSVPLHWFMLFDPDERHYVDPKEGRGPRLTYLTTAAAATGRLERLVHVVDETIEEAEDLLALLADVLDWAEQFDPASILELDYAGLTTLVPAGLLEADRTCGELWEAVDALERGDLLTAATHYGAARSRWTMLRDKPYAN